MDDAQHFLYVFLEHVPIFIVEFLVDPLPLKDWTTSPVNPKAKCKCSSIAYIYILHKPHPTKVSLQVFATNFGKKAHRILLKPLEEMGYKFNIALAFLIFGNWSLHQNTDGKTIVGTFSPDSNVLVLCGILTILGTMSVQNVAVAYKIYM